MIAKLVRDLSSDPELMSLLRRTMEVLQDYDLDLLAGLLREDAMASSPFLSSDEESAQVLHGRQEIIDHFRAIEGEFANFRILDVFADAAIYKVLLSDGDRRLVVVIEPDQAFAQIRRIIMCPSLLTKVMSVEYQKTL